MAESAVNLAANWLGKVLVEEGKYLWGTEDKVAELRSELLWMQRFLKTAESLENKDEIVDQWVLQIKEYVSEAEDIIEDFIIDIVSRRRQIGWVNKLKRWSCIVKELWALHQVASSIDSLTLKISKLTPKLTTYGMHPADGLRAYRTQEANLLDQLEGQRMSYAHLEHKKIVGLDQDTNEIVKLLLDPKAKRRVVAMYGMGGLGKTTLATNVYNHSEIKAHFMYHAWAYISKQFQFQNVLHTLLASLTSKSIDMFSGKKVEALIKELCETLQKSKCLVVLDDVWETKVWDYLESVFPRDGGESGSRVLLTTRKQDVAKHADPLALPKPDRLKDDESWELLKHSLGWVSDDGDSSGEKQVASSIVTSEDHGAKKVQIKDVGGFRLGPKMFGDDGPKVEKLGMEMVKNCNGIPLAIVVLGGILRKKETLEGWRLVSENISSYLRRGNDHGKSYMEVLVLSYTDLPYHLKPCFLHLGNFPEDYEIQAEKLYRMWVAQGLITWPYDRLSSTESLEDIANEYLSLLVQAGMVQIVNSSDGRIKAIRIHDLMRDVCLQKAATENFFSMIDHRSCPDEPQILTSSMNHARLLHMAIHLGKDVKNYLPDFLTSKAHKYLKSLFFFGGQEVPEREVHPWMKRICNDFPWLRVLDIEGLHLKGRLTKDVQKMKHLRYLSLKGTDVSELPSSIGNLMFLQTLDLRVSYSGSPARIPNTLWKLERLRHLFLPKISYEIKKSRFLWLHTLRCLEILKNLEVRILEARDLQKFRKLKKLSVKDVADDMGIIRNIVNSPAAKSGHLRSCSLCVKGSVIDSDPRIFARFDCLHLLKVTDKILSLEEHVLPQSLAELYMESCELKNDPTKILGSLRHLKHLSLGYNSFVGKVMTCKAKTFPQLVRLDLQGLTNLEEWTLENESMSELKKLIIMDCGKLKRIPDALPRSVQVTCSPCISGIEKRGTCNYYGATFNVVDYQEVFIGRADDTRKLVKLLMDDQSKKVVLLGPGGIGKATLVKRLYRQPEINEKFGAIALVCCPHRRIPSSPTQLIKELLRQLDPVSSKGSSESSNLTIEDVMRRQKCLVILTDLAASSEDLDVIFGTHIPDGSKILLSTDKISMKEHNKIIHSNLKPLSEDDSFTLFSSILGGSLNGTEGDEKAKLGKYLLKHCSGHPQSIIMLAGLLAMKKSLTEWQNFRDKVMKEAEGPHPILHALCYDDLPPYLKDCFLYLANFPENTEIRSKKLYQMWTAAGFISLKDDGISSLKRRKGGGIGEVEKLFENIAASYLNELVVRGLVQAVKRGPDKRICTCRLHNTLRRLCLQKAEEKGFMLVHQVKSTSASNGRATGVDYKGRQVSLQSLRLVKQREKHVPTINRPKPPVPASNEIEHFSVYLNQSDMEILDAPASSNDQLKSLLFFPHPSDTKSGDYNWQSFIRICDRFLFLQVLDLEGMEMIKGTLHEDVGKLTQLKYLSLKGTYVGVLPSTIQQLSHLQTLDLRVIPSLVIPGDSFRFHHLRHLYLPDSFSVTIYPKLQLGGFIPLQTLVNLHTGKVDLDCVSDLKNLRRVGVNYIQSENELDDKLKYKGTSIEVGIKSKILNSTVLSSFQNLKNMIIVGSIPGSLHDGMFPKCLKELKLKKTALVEDPLPILRQLPGVTHLLFDHDSFLGKKLTFSLGFPRLAHLTLRLLSNLEKLDMIEAEHLRHIDPIIIDCWRLEVKLPTGAEIEVGPLGHHPLMELLQVVDLKDPLLEAGDNDAFHETKETMIDDAEMIDEEGTKEQMESELLKRKRPASVDAGPSKPINDSDYASRKNNFNQDDNDGDVGLKSRY